MKADGAVAIVGRKRKLAIVEVNERLGHGDRRLTNAKYETLYERIANG